MKKLRIAVGIFIQTAALGVLLFGLWTLSPWLLIGVVGLGFGLAIEGDSNV